MRSFVGVLAVSFVFASAPIRAQAADSSASHPSPAKPRDSFIGLDKPKHSLLSFFLESGTFAAIQATGGGRRTAVTGATVLTAAIGLGREVHDRRTKGLFSFGDLLWDALGVGTALVMLRHTY